MVNSLVAKCTIAAIYTTVPKKMSGSSHPSCKVIVPENQALDEQLRKRMQIVVFFDSKSGDDSGWHVGGWIKETLGAALEETPVLAGRLKRSIDDGSLEIVCNDGGVRCIEAEMPLNLMDFLESNEKGFVEGQLVHWIDIDEQTPQFSPLLYIQVTNFQCGGYSIGLSYSMLLGDPFLMTKFLTRWADIHKSIAYEKQLPKNLLFHTPNMGRNVCSSPNTNTPNTTTTTTTTTTARTPLTLLFNICTTKNANTVPGDDTSMYFALLCIKEAESKLGREMSSQFTLITKEQSGDTKIEVSSKHGTIKSPKELTYQLSHSSWKDLRTNDISFLKKNAPVNVAHWVSSDILQGMVLVVHSSPSNHKHDMDIYITFPI